MGPSRGHLAQRTAEEGQGGIRCPQGRRAASDQRSRSDYPRRKLLSFVPPKRSWDGTNGDAALPKACGRVSAVPHPGHGNERMWGDRSRAKSAAHEDGTTGVVGAEIRDDAQTATILGISGIDEGGGCQSLVDAAKCPVMRSRLPSL